MTRRESREESREDAVRLAALGRLDAVRADADEVLQELVDDVKGVFGADLCVVHLMLSGSLYFRVWSGPLPRSFAESREIPSEQSMCPQVVESASPLVVGDLLATERFRDHFVCAVGGLRFYAGTPLVTSRGEVIGTLCLLGVEPRKEFGDGEMTTLSAFARAVVGRLELLGALKREQTVREEEARRGRELRRILDQSLDIFTTIGFDGMVKDVNRACMTVLGYEPEELLGRRYLDLIHPEDRAQAVEAAKRLYRGETVALFQNRYLRKDGDVAWIEWSAASLPGEETYHCVARDITARKLAEEERRRAEEKYHSIFENAVEGIFQTSLDGRFVTTNPAMARIFGYETPEELKSVVVSIERQLFADPGRRAELASLLEAHGRVSDFVSRGIRKDGSAIWVSANAHVLHGADGQVLGYEGTLEDITERKELEERLEHQAFHDALTGLPNRALFADRLEHALARTERREHASVAVLFMDLDNFKRVNDSLGHEAGDCLLVEVAERLRGCLRPVDTAARLGGDEFTVLLEDVAGEGDAVRVAERIIEALRAPFEVRDHEVLAATSIGIALGDCSRDRAADLMRDADLAMYRAKSRGKARYEVFETAMGARALERLELENGIRKALERGEFRLHYQPTVLLDTNLEDRLRLTGDPTVGFEALVRWEHPERGLVPPSEFIPLAEETGLIVPLGRWVLNEACRQAREWRESFPPEAGARPLTMSVNLSAEQFRQPDLAQDVARALRASGLRPDELLLEISESVIMEDARSTSATLRDLKAIGVGICIDDFGTGYSSLAYLERFPVDHLKIDHSFVRGLGEEPRSKAVILGMVGLAQTFGIKVIAEGVETEGQLDQLRAMRCDLAQGYHFVEPLSGEAAARLLASVK